MTVEDFYENVPLSKKRKCVIITRKRLKTLIFPSIAFYRHCRGKKIKLERFEIASCKRKLEILIKLFAIKKETIMVTTQGMSQLKQVLGLLFEYYILHLLGLHETTPLDSCQFCKISFYSTVRCLV